MVMVKQHITTRLGRHASNDTQRRHATTTWHSSDEIVAWSCVVVVRLSFTAYSDIALTSLAAAGVASICIVLVPQDWASNVSDGHSSRPPGLPVSVAVGRAWSGGAPRCS